jgi:uncharacterized protein
MIIDELKVRAARAVKEKDEVARDVLRLALGEIQMAEARAGSATSEEEAAAIVRKLVKSNEETIAAAGEGERATTLRHEIEVLREVLPKTMSVDEIAAALAGQAEAIRAAKSDGQATGVAIKHLKSAGGRFEGNDVAAAVKKIRA